MNAMNAIDRVNTYVENNVSMSILRVPVDRAKASPSPAQRGQYAAKIHFYRVPQELGSLLQKCLGSKNAQRYRSTRLDAYN